MGKEVVGRLRRCIYGTRDAGAIWEETYTNVLKKLGFTQGVSSPCCFVHKDWGLSLVVHGDDFTTLGPDWALDKYEAGMKAAFDIELRGRLGLGIYAGTSSSISPNRHRTYKRGAAVPRRRRLR